jgi:hypothetical protein
VATSTRPAQPPLTLDGARRSEPFTVTSGSSDQDASVSLGAGSRACDSEPTGQATFKEVVALNRALAAWINRSHEAAGLWARSPRLRRGVTAAMPVIAGGFAGASALRSWASASNQSSRSWTVFTSSLFVQFVRSTLDFVVARHFPLLSRDRNT